MLRTNLLRSKVRVSHRCYVILMAKLSTEQLTRTGESMIREISGINFT